MRKKWGGPVNPFAFAEEQQQPQESSYEPEEPIEQAFSRHSIQHQHQHHHEEEAFIPSEPVQNHRPPSSSVSSSQRPPRPLGSARGSRRPAFSLDFVSDDYISSEPRISDPIGSVIEQRESPPPHRPPSRVHHHPHSQQSSAAASSSSSSSAAHEESHYVSEEVHSQALRLFRQRMLAERMAASSGNHQESQSSDYVAHDEPSAPYSPPPAAMPIHQQQPQPAARGSRRFAPTSDEFGGSLDAILPAKRSTVRATINHNNYHQSGPSSPDNGDEINDASSNAALQRRRHAPSNDDFGGGLGDILRPHESRIERERRAAVQQRSQQLQESSGSGSNRRRSSSVNAFEGVPLEAALRPSAATPASLRSSSFPASSSSLSPESESSSSVPPRNRRNEDPWQGVSLEDAFRRPAPASSVSGSNRSGNNRASSAGPSPRDQQQAPPSGRSAGAPSANDFGGSLDAILRPHEPRLVRERREAAQLQEQQQLQASRAQGGSSSSMQRRRAIEEQYQAFQGSSPFEAAPNPSERRRAQQQQLQQMQMEVQVQVPRRAPRNNSSSSSSSSAAANGFGSDFVDESDPRLQDYNFLLDLDRIQAVNAHTARLYRGLSPAEINALKKFRFMESKMQKAVGSDGPSTSESCAICLEDFKKLEQIVQLPCSHTFHYGCIKKWLEEQVHCPFCRFNLKTKREAGK